ncbi:MAG: CRISPR-associated endoribonuclease Cas6 [Candidatus Thorarchaeota archaeon]
MRFRVNLAPRRNGHSPPVLSYNYQHDVASMFYNLLRSSATNFSQLHESTSYKFFTFSRLEAPRRRALQRGLAILSDDCYLWFTSADPALARLMANLLVSERVVSFGGLEFEVLGVSIPARYEPTEHRATFDTMSGVLLRKQIEAADGRTQTWDLSPSDPEFTDRLTANLRNKFETYHGRDMPGEIRVESVGRAKQQRIAIKDTFHRAHLMRITLRAEPEVLKFAYDCGLGEKNSMGFGMVRLGGA